MKHHVLFDEPGGRRARSICGKFVDRITDHATKPDCPDCQKLLADRLAFDLNALDEDEQERAHDHI